VWLTGLGVLTIGAGEHGGFGVSGPPHALRGQLELEDAWASAEHAHLRASFGGFLLEDAGSKNGLVINGQRARRHRLVDGDSFEVGRSAFLYREQPLPTARGAAAALGGPELLDGDPRVRTLAPGWAAELHALARIAGSDLPVLLLGETGVGKEVLAHAIHRSSGRAGPVVAINCASLPAALAEGLLFGHRRGAYSGAVDSSAGLVRSAAGGTLLLDEVGDLPPTIQAVLLRVLQDRVVIGLGEPTGVAVDVRFLAATHRDLDALAATSGFRPDLLARLSGHRVAVPPLRERREDLGLLISAVLDEANAECALAPAAARALLHHAWPGNARELATVLRRALVLCGGELINRNHLPDLARPGRDGEPRTDEGAPGPSPAGPRPPPTDPDERDLYDRLVAELAAHRGNLSAVARSFGKDRRQIHRWLTRFGLQATSFE
jgi:transcriptional regulator with GAF, ATPase, and Fis domain